MVDIINERVEGDLTPEGDFTITLDAYEGLALRVVSSFADDLARLATKKTGLTPHLPMKRATHWSPVFIHKN